MLLLLPDQTRGEREPEDPGHETAQHGSGDVRQTGKPCAVLQVAQRLVIEAGIGREAARTPVANVNRTVGDINSVDTPTCINAPRRNDPSKLTTSV